MTSASSNNGKLTTRERKEELDWIDSVCEGTTNLFCPVPENLPEAIAAMTDEKKKVDEDVLDYVFESVESFTCREDQQNADKKKESGAAESDENIEHQRIAALGEEGDAIDYVFEKVESLVCSPSYDDPEQPGDELIEQARKSDRNSILEQQEGGEENLILEVKQSQFSTSSNTDKERVEIRCKPKHMILGALLFLILVALIVNGVFLLTK